MSQELRQNLQFSVNQSPGHSQVKMGVSQICTWWGRDSLSQHTWTRLTATWTTGLLLFSPWGTKGIRNKKPPYITSTFASLISWVPFNYHTHHHSESWSKSFKGLSEYKTSLWVTGMVKSLLWETHGKQQGLNPPGMANLQPLLGHGLLQEKFTPLQSTSTIDPTETLWNSGEVGIKWCIPSASPLHRGDFHLQCEFSLSKWSNISQLLLVSIDQREINAWKKFCGYTQFSKWNWRGESSADGILLAWRDGKLKF